MFGFKLVTKSSRKLFHFESGKSDLVTLLINFMDENAYLNMHVVLKQHTYNLREFSYTGKFLHGKDHQKLITS